MMRSSYIVYPQKLTVDVWHEEIAGPRPGEVLCQATKSLISAGTESHCLRGLFDEGTNWAGWVKYPFRPGYSMVGQVIEVGEGVTSLKPGDRVTSRTPHQQYFTAPANEVFVLPPWVSDEEGTWARLAGTTQLGVRRAQLELGESVGVIGLGMLGQLVVQYLALMGARRIVAIDTAANRLEMAKAHGATHVLATDAAAARDEVAQITGGRMLDVVLDVTGHPAVLSAAVQLVRRLGRVVLLGDTPVPTQQVLGPNVLSNSVAILGIHGTASPAEYSDFSPWSRAEMTGLFFDYLAQGRMRVADLTTHRSSPVEAPAVYDRLLNERAAPVGLVFDWCML